MDVSTLPPAPQVKGGLSLGAMRQVREYVEVHFDESIDLSMPAGVAGLSVHHFARQFKQSAGVTPHVYLTQERGERAQETLIQADISLAEIAFAAGFFDQGYLARHFRICGTRPREFRWSQRGLHSYTPLRPSNHRTQQPIAYAATASVARTRRFGSSVEPQRVS
jgi:transcriptional regulator GlxA family with amidase domain